MRIVVVGNSGSGKTWLATSLAASTMVPVIHLDDLFWEPGGFDKKREQVVVMRLVEEYQSGDSWIVEGVFGELATIFADVADLFIWLDIDWSTCKTRLERRGSQSKKHMSREQSETGLKKLLDSVNPKRVTYKRLTR